MLAVAGGILYIYWIKKSNMKNLFIITILLFISCSSDDSTIITTKDRGSIDLIYNGKTLKFGSKSYTGWLQNEQNDTIARFYNARIDVNETDYYEIKLYAYLNNTNEINKLNMEFTPVENGEGWTYQYTLDEKPMIYKNTEFNGIILKSNFEGFLYYHPTEDNDPIHLINGKINIPIKGLDIDWSQW